MEKIPLAETPAEIAELLAHDFGFHVRGLNDDEAIAIFHPVSLSSKLVEAVIEWHGTPLLSTLVNNVGDESLLGQMLVLVYCASGPDTVKVVPVLASDAWSEARLRLPDVNGVLGNSVKLRITRREWTATFEFSKTPELNAILAINEKLCEHAVGTVLAEMASSYMLGKDVLNFV